MAQSLTIYIDDTLVCNNWIISPMGTEMRIESSTVTVRDLDTSTSVTWTYSGGGTFLGLSVSDGAASPDAGLAVGQTKTFSVMQKGTHYYYSVASGGGGGGNLSITYNNSTIHTASSAESFTLPTNGKVMASDLVFTLEGSLGLQVSYGNTQIINASSAGTFTLPCNGKVMSGDITGTVTGGGASTISFTIAGVAYQADDGMTWGQWVGSAYNTGRYMVAMGYISKEPSATYVVAVTEGDPVFVGDTISNGTSYVYVGNL